jgi:hypothetical protein
MQLSTSTRVLGILMLLVFVVGATGLSLTSALVALSGVALFVVVGRQSARRERRARRDPRALALAPAAPEKAVSELESVTLLAPPLRYRAREPVALSLLARALETTDLGGVVCSSRLLSITSARGERVELCPRDVDSVTRADLDVKTSSSEFAVLVCDVLVSQLGPMVVRVGGVDLELDGTRPREELKRLLWIAQADQDRKLEWAKTSASGKGPEAYLH